VMCSAKSVPMMEITEQVQIELTVERLRLRVWQAVLLSTVVLQYACICSDCNKLVIVQS
jgi:hypothetical protein